MPQTVYDVGDPITSRLKLGVTPDGTTVTTLTVYRPDGTVVSGITPSGTWSGTAGDEKTAQWYATNDGTAGGTVTAGLADGDWLAVWKVTGTGASVTPKVYNVAPLPGAALRVAWSPFLSDVADHVPWLTVDLRTPGDQTYLGTFTGWTAPTDEQAQRHIDAAASIVAPIVGVIPAASQPQIYRLARTATALRAAATLARAFPRNNRDIDTASALLADAKTALTSLDDATANLGANPVNAVPVLYAPDPVWWGDVNL
jgi:hypothetical protein